MDWHSSPDFAMHDHYLCSQGHVLCATYYLEEKQEVQYRADAAICQVCPVKAQCAPNTRSRYVHRSSFADYLERAKAYEQTFAYQKALAKRRVWVEPLFGEGKQWHGMGRFRGTRGTGSVNCEALVIATGQNLKRLRQQARMGAASLPCGGCGSSASWKLGAGSIPKAQPAEKRPTWHRWSVTGHLQGFQDIGCVSHVSVCFKNQKHMILTYFSSLILSTCMLWLSHDVAFALPLWEYG
jgi:Transposase DDE domain